MKIRSLTAVLLAITVAAPAYLSAAGDKAAKNKTLVEGKYTATLTPTVDEKTADKIEKQLSHIKELRAIDVEPENSALKFSVEGNAQVSVSRITNAVHAAAPGTKVSEPVIETPERESGAVTPPTRTGY